MDTCISKYSSDTPITFGWVGTRCSLARAEALLGCAAWPTEAFNGFPTRPGSEYTCFANLNRLSVEQLLCGADMSVSRSVYYAIHCTYSYYVSTYTTV